MEIMDALAITAASRGRLPLPGRAGAVLLVELDGAEVEVRPSTAAVTALCTDAFEIRVPRRGGAGRPVAGRKSAFAAVGRIKPDYIGAGRLAPDGAAKVLGEIDALAEAAGIRVSHASRRRRQLTRCALQRGRAGRLERAEGVAGAILELCGRARRLDHRRARRRRREGPFMTSCSPGSTSTR